MYFDCRCFCPAQGNDKVHEVHRVADLFKAV